MKILIINGPNLNLLGVREVGVYGTETLDDINSYIDESTKSELVFCQYNCEGDIISALHNAMGVYGGIVLNAGAYTHYSYAISDAIKGINIPTIEVHLSDINLREDFRKISVIRDNCAGSIMGKGKDGYILAVEMLEKI